MEILLRPRDRRKTSRLWFDMNKPADRDVLGQLLARRKDVIAFARLLDGSLTPMRIDRQRKGIVTLTREGQSIPDAVL